MPDLQPAALAVTVNAALERLPAGQLSNRVSLTIQRYGLAHQSLAWLIDQLQRLAQLQQQGWSLQRVYSLKGRRDLRIPEIVYCRNLGTRGLLELMQVFLPMSDEDRRLNDHTA